MTFRSERALCLSKYGAVFVGTYAGLCRALRRNLRLHLNLNLDLNLDLALCPALNRALLRKPFQKPSEKPNPILFHRLYGFKYRQSFNLVNLAPCRRMLPPGQSLGRPLPGEIVVQTMPYHYIWTPSHARQVKLQDAKVKTQNSGSPAVAASLVAPQVYLKVARSSGQLFA